MTPYLASMAYAVRVKLDEHLVECSATSQVERAQSAERARGVVSELIALLQAAMTVTLSDPSLLIATLRRSVQLMLSPEDTPAAIEMWDDGLSGIRWPLWRVDCPPSCIENGNRTTGGGGGGGGGTIKLENAKEVFWWSQFAN